jgi:hypothetical protein
MIKIGRNDPCPCGSGKKYKKCCQDKSGQALSQLATMNMLTDELHQFVDKHYMKLLEPARREFWWDIDSEGELRGLTKEIAERCFYEWLVFDFEAYENQTFIDLLIHRKPNLTPEELKVLSIMRSSAVSLYEVEEIFQDKGILLKDLLLDGLYEIDDAKLSTQIRKGTMLAVRLLHLDEKYVIVGVGNPFQREVKDELMEYVKAEHEDFRKEYPGTSMGDFLKKVSYVFNDFWCGIWAVPDEESLKKVVEVLSKMSFSVYNIDDEQGVIRRMDAMEGVKRVVAEKNDADEDEEQEKEKEKEEEKEQEQEVTWMSEEISPDGEKISVLCEIYNGKFNITSHDKGLFEKWKTIVEERLAGLVVFERNLDVSDIFDMIKAIRDNALAR